MDDDLRRRFEKAAERAPEGTPDLTTVQRQGRRDRYRRRGLIAISTAACVGLAGIGIAAVVNRDTAAPRPVEAADHTGDEVFVPAEKGEPTYVLSDFKIYYPYREIDHMRGMAPGSSGRRQHCANPAFSYRCETERDKAGVSYEWRWATKTYPGDLDCRLRLYDNNGNLVGSAMTGLSGLESRSRGRRTVVPVKVSKKPARAEGECEAGQYKAGPGWRITFVRAEPYTPTHVNGEATPEERIRLIFDVEELDEHADSRACRMKMWFESGRTRSGKFTTNTAKVFENMETQLPASDPVTNAKVTCGAIRDPQT